MDLNLIYMNYKFLSKIIIKNYFSIKRNYNLFNHLSIEVDNNG